MRYDPETRTLHGVTPADAGVIAHATADAFRYGLAVAAADGPSDAAYTPLPVYARWRATHPTLFTSSPPDAPEEVPEALNAALAFAAAQGWQAFHARFVLEAHGEGEAIPNVLVNPEGAVFPPEPEWLERYTAEILAVELQPVARHGTDVQRGASAALADYTPYP